MFLTFVLAQSFLFAVVFNSELSKYQQSFNLKISEWQITKGVNQTSDCLDILMQHTLVFGGKSGFTTNTIITSHFQTKGKTNSFYKIIGKFSIFKSAMNIQNEVYILLRINGVIILKIPYGDQKDFITCSGEQAILTNYEYEYEIEGEQFQMEFTQVANTIISDDFYWGIANFELNTYECDPSLCSKCTGLPRNCTVFCDISCSNCSWKDPSICTSCSSPSNLDQNSQKCGLSNEVTIGKFFSPLTIETDLTNLLNNKSLDIYPSSTNQWISSCLSHKIFGGLNIFYKKSSFIIKIPVDFNFYATRIDFRFFKINEWINNDYLQVQGQFSHAFPYPQTFEALTGNICGDSSDGPAKGEIIDHHSILENNNISPVQWKFSTSLSTDFGSWGIQSLFLTAYKCSDTCFNCTGPNASDCIACHSTHIKIDNTCVKCQDPCLTCYHSQNLCSSCSAPLFLFGSKCIENCPLGYYGENNTCYNCLSNCEDCSSLEYCSKCLKNHYAWEPLDKNRRYCFNETFCNSMLTFWVDKTNYLCAPCDVSCADCSFNSSNCTECAYNYYHSSSSPFSCLKECPVGEYKENITKTCKSCPPECSSCYSPTICLSCSHSFFLLNFKCSSDCPSPLFPDSISNKCLSCTYPCKTCHSSSTLCTSCVNNLFLDVSSCSESCPTTKFPNSQAICQDCTPPCKTCNLSPERCNSCLINFLDRQKEKCVDILDCPRGTVGYENVCVDCKAPCATCLDRIDKCTECVPNFFLNLNFTCLKNCDPGYYTNQTNWKCSKCDISCMECKDAFNCTKCTTDLFLFEDKCLINCPDSFWGDQKERKCIECSIGCKNCLNSSSFGCLSCLDNFFFFENRCLTSCPEGKNVYPNDMNHQCQNCHSWCSNCLDGTPSNCSQCNSNFFLFNSTCSPSCPHSFYPFSSNSSCLACNRTCSSCNSSYCFDCSPGFFLHNGLCLDTCPSNFYAESSSKTCMKCPSTCLNCTSALNCSSCIAPFLLHDYECLSNCPPQTYPFSTSAACEPCASPCLNCVSLTTCQTCVATYFFSETDGKCATDCPKGYFPSEKESKCIACSRLCAQCSASGYDNCSECSSSFFLDVNTCKNKCPNGTYAEEKTRKCEKCDLACATCYAQSEKTCYSCNQGFYLKENYCTKDCGDGFYPDKTSFQCIKCSYECSTCESREICLSCSPNFYFISFNKICSNSCPLSNYKNDSLRSCEPCHYSCATCNSYSSTSCLSCSLPNYLYSSSCLPKCPSKFYPSYPPPICAPCTNDCLSCIASSDSLSSTENGVMDPLSASKCTLCPLNLLIDQSLCVKSCPYKTYSNSTHCLPCHFSCVSCYEGYNTTCNNCASPFFLLNNGCLEKCPRNLYSDPIIRSCYKKCHYSCQDCEGPNEDECSSCVGGVGRAKQKNLSVGKCECIEGWFEQGVVRCGECIPECLACSEKNTCTSCRWNRRLRNGRCRCLTGYYDNEDGINCFKCHENCKDCNGPMKNNCISCSVEKNWQLNLKGECQCQTGFYLREGLFCEQCHYTCANCTGPLKKNCVPKQCVGNHYYDESINECVCPFWAEDQGFKQNCSNITFLNCHPHCADRQCFGLADSNCYSCADRRRFDNYTCPCNDGYFEYIATKTCNECHYTCKTCTGPLFSDCIKCSSVTRGSSGVPVKGVCNCESGKIETLEVKCPSIPLSLDACQKSFEITVILNTPTMAILALSHSPLIAIKFIEICQFISFLSYLNLQYPLNTKEYFTVLNYFNIDSIFTDEYTLNQTNNISNSSQKNNNDSNSKKLFRFLQINEADFNSTEKITKSNRFERIKYGEGNFLKNSYTLLIINLAAFIFVCVFNFLIKSLKLEKQNVLSRLNRLLVWGLPIRIFVATSLQLLLYLGLQFSKNDFLSTGPLNIIVTLLTSVIFFFLVVYLFKVANRNYAFSEFSNKFVVIWEGTDMYFSYKRNYFFFNLIKKIIFVSFILQTGITPFTQTVGCLVTSFIFLIYLIFLNPFLSRLVWIFTIVTEFSLMNLLVVILIYDYFEPEKTTVKLVFGYLIIFSIISTLISTFAFFVIQTFRFIRNFVNLLKQKKESNEQNSFEFAIKSYTTQMKKKNHINTVYSKEKQIELEKKEDEIRKKEAEKKKIEELEIEKSERSGLKTIFLKHKNKRKKKKNSIDMDIETDEFSEENDNSKNSADIFEWKKEKNFDHLEVEMKKYD